MHLHCSSSSLLSSLDVPSFVTDCSYFYYHYHVPRGRTLVPLNMFMSLSGSSVLDPRSKSALQFRIMQLEKCFYSRLFIWLKLMSIGHRHGERRVKGQPLYIMTCARGCTRIHTYAHDPSSIFSYHDLTLKNVRADVDIY